MSIADADEGNGESLQRETPMEKKRDDQSTAQQVKPTEAPKPRTDKSLTDEDANAVVGGFNPQPDPPANHRGGGI